jgi:hypothetical protein
MSTSKKTQKSAERPIYDWPDEPIRVRLLRARAALRGHRLWSKFKGDQRDYDAFSIHELALAVQAELDKVGVDYQFTVEKFGSAPGQRYVEGWAVFTCVERAGEEYDISDQCRVYTVGEGFDQSDKGFGKAISYARKSGMIQGLNLAIGQDNEASNEKPATPEPAAPVNGGPASDLDGPPKFAFFFDGNYYPLIQPQIIDSVTKYLASTREPSQVESWLKANEATIAELYRVNDRLGYALKRMAAARIDALSEQQVAQ